MRPHIRPRPARGRVARCAGADPLTWVGDGSRRSQWRRHVITKRIGTLLMATVLVISACSGGGATNAPAASQPAGASQPAAASEAPAPAESAGGAPTTGELLIWADDKRAAALMPLAEQFGSEQGVTVKVEAISKDLITNFKNASQAG